MAEGLISTLTSNHEVMGWSPAKGEIFSTSLQMTHHNHPLSSDHLDEILLNPQNHPSMNHEYPILRTMYSSRNLKNCKPPKNGCIWTMWFYQSQSKRYRRNGKRWSDCSFASGAVWSGSTLRSPRSVYLGLHDYFAQIRLSENLWSWCYVYSQYL